MNKKWNLINAMVLVPESEVWAEMFLWDDETGITRIRQYLEDSQMLLAVLKETVGDYK